MPLFHLKHLNRKAYIASVATIQDPKTANFAEMSLQWWDKHFSWEAHGCVVLADADDAHLCYIFYKIDRYRMYMTIHNIFTPLCERRKGYAYELLKMVFDLAVAGRVSRFKLVSISNSLDFYLSLGFVYWGLNSAGDYYCDLPVPAAGLDGLDAMVQNSDTTALIGNRYETIYKKVHGHETGLSAEQTHAYDRDRVKMGEHYMLNAFNAFDNGSAAGAQKRTGTMPF